MGLAVTEVGAVDNGAGKQVSGGNQSGLVNNAPKNHIPLTLWTSLQSLMVTKKMRDIEVVRAALSVN